MDWAVNHRWNVELIISRRRVKDSFNLSLNYKVYKGVLKFLTKYEKGYNMPIISFIIIIIIIYIYIFCKCLS